MNTRQTLNLGVITCLIGTIYVIYYLLLHDNPLPFSISSVLAWLNHWVRHWHVLAVGLIPIYLAFMIFGAAVLCSYFGSTVQRWIELRIKNN